MKKTISNILLFFIITSSFAQYGSFPVEKHNQMPQGIENTKGKFKKGYSWNDNNGLNYFIYTIESKVIQSDEPTESSFLYCYHYKKNEYGYELVRKTLDFIKECQANAINELFIENNGVFITDLDENGLAEITYVYKMCCGMTDVSPLDMKLIMLEDGEKYAIRGDEVIFNPSMRPTDGMGRIDPSFNKAPKEFLDFAKLIWCNFVLNLEYW